MFAQYFWLLLSNRRLWNWMIGKQRIPASRDSCEQLEFLSYARVLSPSLRSGTNLAPLWFLYSYHLLFLFLRSVFFFLIIWHLRRREYRRSFSSNKKSFNDLLLTFLLYNSAPSFARTFYRYLSSSCYFVMQRIIVVDPRFDDTQKNDRSFGKLQLSWLSNDPRDPVSACA